MDNIQIGKLIRSLRTEKNMTQLQLAEQMGITDKAISKWERGLGSPDISLLPDLSRILGINIGKMLAGDLRPNENDRGNLQKVKFYVCPSCGGVLTSTSEAEVSCCGRICVKSEPQPADEEHRLRVEPVEYDYYITCAHEMIRSHHLSFLACVTQDQLVLIRLYPEQDIEIRIPRAPGSKLFYYCTRHGLMVMDKYV